jgi:type 1 fimbria pilin
MKRVLIISIALIFALNMSAKNDDKTKPAAPATVEFSGKIIDSQTGEALTGVKVYIEDVKQETYTDFDGNFSLLAPNSNDVTIKVSYISYEEKKINANIQLEKNVTVSLDMIEQ